VNKRRTTFDKHHKNIQEARLNTLRKALKILGRGRYDNLTQLAEAAAKLVTEFELKDLKDGETPEPCSYTTLMRNKKYYRPALEAFFSSDAKVPVQSSISLEDYEALKIHCANLDHQNKMLKDRLAGIDLTSTTRQLTDSKDDSDENDTSCLADIALLIRTIKKINNQMPDMFDHIEVGSISEEHPSAGFWGPDGLILTIEEVKRIEALEIECRENDI
jgi:hypothetical protein